MAIGGNLLWTCPPSATRRGKLQGLVTVARSILVIIWHLVASPATRYHNLGPSQYASRIYPAKKIRNHICQQEALGAIPSPLPR